MTVNGNSGNAGNILNLLTIITEQWKIKKKLQNNKATKNVNSKLNNLNEIERLLISI